MTVIVARIGDLEKYICQNNNKSREDIILELIDARCWITAGALEWLNDIEKERPDELNSKSEDIDVGPEIGVVIFFCWYILEVGELFQQFREDELIEEKVDPKVDAVED